MWLEARQRELYDEVQITKRYHMKRSTKEMGAELEEKTSQFFSELNQMYPEKRNTGKSFNTSHNSSSIQAENIDKRI
jgi:hypothetical protein